MIVSLVDTDHNGLTQVIGNGPNIGYLPITIPNKIGNYGVMVQTSINGLMYSNITNTVIISPIPSTTPTPSPSSSPAPQTMTNDQDSLTASIWTAIREYFANGGQ